MGKYDIFVKTNAKESHLKWKKATSFDFLHFKVSVSPLTRCILSMHLRKDDYTADVTRNTTSLVWGLQG